MRVVVSDVFLEFTVQALGSEFDHQGVIADELLASSGQKAILVRYLGGGSFEIALGAFMDWVEAPGLFDAGLEGGFSTRA